jgi:putative nucleotidyltransferase with HDIG domain
MTTLSPESPVLTLKGDKTIFETLEAARTSGALPSLATVVCELQTMTRNNHVRIDDAAELVRLDLGMSMRVLKMANSVFYAPKIPIVDVQEAILLMGLSTFRRTVLATSCIEMTSSVPKSTLYWTEFWLHAVGVGHLTMELAGRLEMGKMDPDSFYLMGLLHDIGKVVMAYVIPDEFDKIYKLAAAQERAPAVLEAEMLGVDHGFLGAWFLEKQGIPTEICEAIRIHHSSMTEPSPHLDHARLIRLADELARYFMLGKSGNHVPVVDPFSSEEWNWYMENSRHSITGGISLKDAIIEQVSRSSDLVRKIIF